MANPKAASGSPELVRVVNKTEAAYDLPPIPATADHPGHPVRTLIPGGNNVKLTYLNALGTHTVEDRFGKQRKPHADLLQRLEDNGIISIDTDPRATARAEGMEPPEPKDFIKLPAAVAIEFVLTEQSLTRLDRWLKAVRNDEVRQVLVERIAKLS